MPFGHFGISSGIGGRSLKVRIDPGGMKFGVASSSSSGRMDFGSTEFNERHKTFVMLAMSHIHNDQGMGLSILLKVTSYP